MLTTTGGSTSMSDEPRDLPLPLEIADPAHEAAVSVWWTGSLLKKAAGRIFQPFDSSDAQFNLMIILRNSPGPHTQNYISRRLMVDKSNVTGLVDRLEVQALVERKPVAGDRRSHHVVLTAKGRKVLDQLDRHYHGKILEIVSELRPKEYAQITELMARLRKGLARSGLLD
jgi:DNA-binding MarR family transcriptional regulator